MDRRTLSTILLAVGIFILVYSFLGKGCGKDKGQNTALVHETFEVLKLQESPMGAPCTIDTATYSAVVDPGSGGLFAFRIKGAKYIEGGAPIDIASRTTIDDKGRSISNYTPLRAIFRNDPSETQVPGDLVQFEVEKKDGGCVLRHRRPGVVEIARLVRPSPRPYELELVTTVTNLSGTPRKHAFSTPLYALQFKSQEGGMFSRPAANAIFQGACSFDGGKMERKDKGSLKEWYVKNGNVEWASISSAYIGQAVIPVADGAGTTASGSSSPHCSLIAEDRGAPGTDGEQALLRAYVAYPPRELAAGQSWTYQQIAFIGPKERPVLAAAAGGGRHLDQLIDLGTFSVIAKVLVRFLAFIHGLSGSWGIAIIFLTITVRVVLLPLTLPQIKSSISMRKLKPELDKLNAKFAHDAQAKMLATSELYKKHGVSPLAGCLPALMQMPVWFALYTALQTAIELFHERFLFWSDLSSPDPRFVLPLVLGVTMFVQQKVTPMQMDPAQQKIFTYFMPGLFTVFMLFLPAGLGVYMLTNSVLGIVQTVAVERYMKGKIGTTGADVKVTVAVTPATANKPKPARELARRPKTGEDEPS